MWLLMNNFINEEIADDGMDIFLKIIVKKTVMWRLFFVWQNRRFNASLIMYKNEEMYENEMNPQNLGIVF